MEVKPTKVATSVAGTTGDIFAIDNWLIPARILEQSFYNPNARFDVASLACQDRAKAARSKEFMGSAVVVKLVWGDSPGWSIWPR